MSRSYTFTVEWKDPVIVVAGDIGEGYSITWERLTEKEGKA